MWESSNVYERTQISILGTPAPHREKPSLTFELEKLYSATYHSVSMRNFNDQTKLTVLDLCRAQTAASTQGPQGHT